MRSRLLGWSAIVLPFLGLQGVIQATNIVGGILLVRFLPPAELAVFTVAFAAFTILSIIADGGVHSAMVSLGAQVRDDPRALRALMETVFRTRTRLAGWGALAALPFLAYSLVQLGYPTESIAVAAVLAAAYVGFNVAYQPWMVALQLHGRYRQLQIIALVNALARTAVIGGFLWWWPSGLLALAFTAALSGLMFVQMRQAGRLLVSDEPSEDDFGPRVQAVVQEALPGVVFYAVRGQVTVGLLAVLGTQVAVASVGALTRVAAVYLLLTPLLANVIAPRFALLPPARLSRTYWALVSGAVVVASLVLASVMAVGPFVLSILGAPYSGLEVELALMLATAGVGFVSTVIGELNKSRSWLRRSWLLIPAVLGVQAVALWALPVSTLRGALVFGLFSLLPDVIVGLYQMTLGVRDSSVFPNDIETVFV